MVAPAQRIVRCNFFASEKVCAQRKKDNASLQRMPTVWEVGRVRIWANVLLVTDAVLQHPISTASAPLVARREELVSCSRESVEPFPKNIAKKQTPAKRKGNVTQTPKNVNASWRLTRIVDAVKFVAPKTAASPIERTTAANPSTAKKV